MRCNPDLYGMLAAINLADDQGRIKAEAPGSPPGAPSFYRQVAPLDGASLERAADSDFGPRFVLLSGLPSERKSEWAERAVKDIGARGSFVLSGGETGQADKAAGSAVEAFLNRMTAGPAAPELVIMDFGDLSDRDRAGTLGLWERGLAAADRAGKPIPPYQVEAVQFFHNLEENPAVPERVARVLPVLFGETETGKRLSEGVYDRIQVCIDSLDPVCYRPASCPPAWTGALMELLLG